MSTTLAVVLAAALAWCHGWWAHGRTAAERAEREARPPGPPEPAIDAVAAVAMAGWCCDAWAATAGADHDEATCTRKDHHA